MTSKHESMSDKILPLHLGVQSEWIQLFIPAYRARISTPAGVSQTGPSFLQGSVAGLSKDLAKSDVVEHKLQTLSNQEMAATKDIPHNVGCGCKVGYVISSLSQWNCRKNNADVNSKRISQLHFDNSRLSRTWESRWWRFDTRKKPPQPCYFAA